MDVPTYKAALENEKGIKLCSKKQKKLEALNAGKLEVLKQCILENKMEIEQEMINIKNVSISSTVIIL